MVLQQKANVPIWGWADPGEEITVRFGSQVLTTNTSREGKWAVMLSPLPAGGPWEMTIQGNSTLVLEDILIGEVWLCSGQSNMAFPLASTRTAESEVTKADYPQIRLFTVPRASSLEPRDDVKSSWEVCTPDITADFSAVGYFFGRRLHEALEIPVGLIDSSWGGTQAEEWTDWEDLEKVSAFKPILDRWKQTSPEIKTLFREPRPFELWFDEMRLLPQREEPGKDHKMLANFDNRELRTTFGGRWSDEWVEPEGQYALEVREPGYGDSAGASVIRGNFEVSQWPMLKVDLTPNGKPIDLSEFKGLSFYSRGDGAYRIHFLQASITDWDNYATITFRATPDWSSNVLLFRDLKQAGWGKRMPFTTDKITGLVVEVRPFLEAVVRPPAGLFNGMIMPIVPYAIRGTIWYQGEGNAGRAYQYRQLLPILIRSWRRHWQRGDFPFLIVQLPNFRPYKSEPGESDWAELREAQLMSLAVPQTGLAISIDLGEADDVHPKDKTEIGNRLAAWALGTTYGRDLVHSGSLFEAVKFDEDEATVTFRHVGGGLVVRNGDRLEGFSLAGSDRKFQWAEARIVDNTVKVHSDKIAKPVALRYAWADNPKCNLYNKEGFPAAPFRTDQWPGLTVDKK